MDMAQAAGLISALGLGSVLQYVIAQLFERFKGQMAIKQAQAQEVENLRTEMHTWREAAYMARLAAIKSGVDHKDLPVLPDKDE